MTRHQVLLFAAAAELAGCDALAVEVPPPVTAGAVMAAIGEQTPQLSDLLPACRLVVDQAFVSPEFPIDAKAELALIPPVSGG
jgi:molybdopterin converting factor small subunit